MRKVPLFMIALAVAIVFLGLSYSVSADTTEYFPTTTSTTCPDPSFDDAGDWATPTNAFSENDLSASATVHGACNTLGGFGVTQTAGDIDKITLKIKARMSQIDPGAPNFRVNLRGEENPGEGFGGLCNVQFEITSTSYVVYTIDLTTYCAPTLDGPPGFNYVPSTFELQVQNDFDGISPPPTAEMDYMSLSVDFTPSAPPPEDSDICAVNNSIPGWTTIVLVIVGAALVLIVVSAWRIAAGNGIDPAEGFVIVIGIIILIVLAAVLASNLQCGG